MNRPYTLSIAYSIALVFLYAVGQLNLGPLTIISNIVFPATAGLTVVSCLHTLRRYGWKSRSTYPTILLFVSVGISMWFLAELTVAVQALYLNIESFPSLADIFYLGGYVWLFLALSQVFNMFQAVFSARMFKAMAVPTVVTASVVSQVLFIPIIASSADFVTLAVSAAYPSIDLVLFALSFSILLIFLQGGIGKAWFFFTLSMLLATVADLLFSYLMLGGFFYRGHPVELLWLWSYVTFMVGLYIHRKEF
ncbi:MAG: hypothetical protein ACE5KC_00640 [Candidatus Bathyarchaeia archaeon]